MNNNIEVLGKLMDAAALRQKVLSNNLANANTPGYVRKDVKFRDALSRALDSGPEAIRDVTPKIVDDTESPMDGNGNNVSLQREMGELAQNAMLYDFAAEMAGQKFGTLRKAISGTK